MELFKALILAVISFAKVSVYLFEQAAQIFPSSRHRCVRDEISILQRDWILYVIKVTGYLYDLQYQKYCVYKCNLLTDTVFTLSFKATRESKNEQMCKERILNANPSKSERWYLDYIEIAASETLSILNFA